MIYIVLFITSLCTIYLYLKYLYLLLICALKSFGCSFCFNYVKHTDLRLCMKCAIQINFPCHALNTWEHSVACKWCCLFWVHFLIVCSAHNSVSSLLMLILWLIFEFGTFLWRQLTSACIFCQSVGVLCVNTPVQFPTYKILGIYSRLYQYSVFNKRAREA